VPSFYTEDLARGRPLRTRFQRDISELEQYFDDFARRHPELRCCMLRYQPEIAPGLDSPLVRYLSLPVVPVELGFDPRLQFLHAADATGAIEAAVANPVRGPVNVAPSGSISLSRALRLLRRPALPLAGPLFKPVMERLDSRLGAGALIGDWIRLLRYGRGVDNTRLVEELGYTPRYDAAAAVGDLATEAAGRRLGPSFHAGAVAGGVARLVRR
jgi:UDP-glucose 4-epimerase